MNGEKSLPKRSDIWIVWTIFERVVITTFFVGLIWGIVRLFAFLIIGEIGMQIVGLIVGIFGAIFATRWGVKRVLAKSIVESKDIVRLSVESMIPWIILEVLALILGAVGLTSIIKFIFNEVIIFLLIYFWFKKLLPETRTN